MSKLKLFLLLIPMQLRLCFSFTTLSTITTTSSHTVYSAWVNKEALSHHASRSPDEDTEDTSLSSQRRRNILLQTALVTPFSIVSFTAAVPQSASAAESSEKPPPIVPLLTTAKRLHAVPLFAIVDGNGTPFHTYDKDSAGGFGYFFTTYSSAEYVLDDAKKAYEKAKIEAAEAAAKAKDSGSIGEDGTGSVPDTWGQAQIVTIPLDVAMQLSVKKTSSIAQNAKEKKFATYYQIIPSTEDLNAALRIENGPRYSERGRVPLFFVDGLTLTSEEEGGSDVVSPVYFRLKDLREEWTKQHSDMEIPKIQVRELNETFRAMITPGGKDKSVRNLIFVPNPESVAKSKGCSRSYKLGEMILTK